MSPELEGIFLITGPSGKSQDSIKSLKELEGQCYTCHSKLSHHSSSVVSQSCLCQNSIALILIKGLHPDEICTL